MSKAPALRRSRVHGPVHSADLETDAERAKLLLDDLRHLETDGTRRGDDQGQRQRLARPVPHAVAVVVRPASAIQQPPGLAQVHRRRGRGTVVDPEEGRGGAIRHVARAAEDRSHDPPAVEREPDGAADVPIAQDRMRPVPIPRIALVEEEKSERRRWDGDDPQVLVGLDAVDIGSRGRDVLRGVGLAREEHVEPCVRIRGRAEDQSSDRRHAEEEPVVRGKLDELARHAANPAVGAASDWGLHERRLFQRARRDATPAGEPGAVPRERRRRRAARRRAPCSGTRPGGPPPRSPTRFAEARRPDPTPRGSAPDRR